MELLPKNHRKIWTETEVEQLINEIKLKLSMEKIAKNHNRTIKAVIYKFIRYLMSKSNDKQIRKIKLNLNDNDLLVFAISRINFSLNVIIISQLLIFLLQFIICII